MAEVLQAVALLVSAISYELFHSQMNCPMLMIHISGFILSSSFPLLSIATGF